MSVRYENHNCVIHTFQGAMSKDVPIDDANIKVLDYAIAIFLVIRGADISYRNHVDKTPLDFCTDSNLARDIQLHSAKFSSNSRYIACFQIFI
jgi:ankyrin repeat protein